MALHRLDTEVSNTAVVASHMKQGRVTMYAEKLDQAFAPASLIVMRAILHHVDRAFDHAFASREISLDGPQGGQIRRLLSSLIKHTLANADSIAEAEESPSPILQACWETLESSDSFAANSLRMAETLHRLMQRNRSISPGELLIALCQDGNGPFVAILKLERMEGLEYLYVHHEDGTWEAILTANHNVVPARPLPQKSAFIRAPGVDIGYHVRLRDHQAKRKPAAAFFCQDFLGCRLLSTPAQRTMAFCEAAERWRDEHREALPRQGMVSFSRALRAHLQRPTVSFSAFADAALGGVPRARFAGQPLADTLAGAVYGPRRDPYAPPPPTFAPDAETARRLLDHTNLTLSTIRLMGPADLRLSGPADAIIGLLEQAEVDGNGQFVLRINTSTVRRQFKPSPKKREEQRAVR
jgi:hypothetical protein